MKSRLSRKIVSTIMVVALLFTSFNVLTFAANTKETLEVNTAKAVSAQFQENNEQATILYSDLIKSFKEGRASASTRSITLSNEQSGYTVNGLSANDYPDSYAGAYVNTQGHLVVLLSNTSSVSKSTFSEQTIATLSEADNVFYGQAQYSYSDLIDVMTLLLDYARESGNFITNNYYFTGFAIDDYQNRVVVFLNSLDSDAIKAFRSNISSSDIIIFEEEPSYAVNTAITTYGEDITYKLDGVSLGWCSIGPRATYQSADSGMVRGFLTCGHAFYDYDSSDTIKAYHSGLNYGTLDWDYYSYDNYASLDVAFIELRSSYDINGTVEVAADDSSYYINNSRWMDAPRGSTVYMYGAGSASEDLGMNSGIVTHSSYTVMGSDGIYLTDQVKANYSVVRGDSGTIIFTESSGDYIPCGVQSRGYFSEGEAIGYEGLFSKLSNVTEEFDLYPR